MERNEHLGALKTKLLDSDSTNVGITGVSQNIGVQGMGGIGKSVLAAALTYDEDIQQAFPDGIIWLTLGQNPDITDITQLQATVVQAIEKESPVFENPVEGKNKLEELFSDKKCLLVLDDVWQSKHANFFRSSHSKLLITTRQSNILTALGAEEYKLDVLDEPQALELLRQSANIASLEDLPTEAKEICEECGYLPLALAMVGAMLKGKPQTRWQKTLERLKNAELAKIRQEFADYPYPNLFKAIHVSVEALPPELQARYLDFAVFPESYSIPEAVFETLWVKDDLGHYDAIDAIDYFVDHSLAQRGYKDGVVLHDLQYDYVRKQIKDVKSLHQKLITNYEQSGTGNWSTVPDDGYIFGHIVNHLEALGQLQKAQEIAKELLTSANVSDSTASVHLFKALALQDSKTIAKKLLKSSSTPTQTICMCLTLLQEEAKDDARRLIKESNQNPEVIRRCINLLKDEAKDDARRLIKESNFPEVICRCIDLLKEGAKDDAKRLIKESGQHPSVICRCIDLLKEEAKDDARRLIKESNQNSNVISICLNLLKEEAKDDAKRLIKESNQNSQIICSCLNLLKEEAKDDARKLIKESNQHSNVISICLKLLKEEAKDDARRLIKESNQNSNVISICLKLLKEEAKDDARRLIKESNQNSNVISICLKLLKEEAKNDAKRLIKESNFPEVICRCIDLLKEETKDDARRLIKESKDHQVICRCIDLLKEEAKPFAVKQLETWQKVNHNILAHCFKVASETLGAQQAADEMLNLWQKPPEKILALLNAKAGPVKEQRALEILKKWHKTYRPLVRAALVALETTPELTTTYCKAILKRWYKEIHFCRSNSLAQYDLHIAKSLCHPLLGQLASRLSFDMLIKESDEPGFLTPVLLEVAGKISRGDWPSWFEKERYLELFQDEDTLN